MKNRRQKTASRVVSTRATEKQKTNGNNNETMFSARYLLCGADCFCFGTEINLGNLAVRATDADGWYHLTDGVTRQGAKDLSAEKRRLWTGPASPVGVA